MQIDEKKLKEIKVKKSRPLQEQFPKIETDRAMGVMVHKDGTIEKRNFE
jgi:hypothetical protein